MKKEIEALDRALLNVMTAHDRKIESYHDIMRRAMAAAQTIIGGMSDFANGHYDLYDELNRKYQDALASLDEGLNGRVPPPLPHGQDENIPNDVETFLREMRHGDQQYPQ